MTEVVKKATGSSGSGSYRMQVFTESDASAGDVIRVDLSLDSDAKQVVIEPVGGSMTVIFNANEHVFANRAATGAGTPFQNYMPNMARKRVSLETTGKPQITIADGVIYTECKTPTRDIYIVSSSATSFNITVR